MEEGYVQEKERVQGGGMGKRREKRNLKKKREEERKGIKRVSQAVSEILC